MIERLRFVEAKDLKAGMVLSQWQPKPSPLQTVGHRQSEPSGALLVKSITIEDDDVPEWRAYNLTVGVDHTYYVGGLKVWVHNAGPGDCLNLARGQLGEKLGSGGVKDVYAYGDKQAVGIVQPGKNIKVITKELDELKKLEDHGLPTVNAQLIRVDGQPAILMDRFAQGSKDVVKTIGKKPKKVGESSLLNQQSIDDLNNIRDTLIEKKIKVDDLQFLIGENGRVVIADPVKVHTKTKPSDKNLITIDLLIKIARGNL